MDEHVMKTYARADEVFVRGSGARLWDERGDEYLDFLGGIAVLALGFWQDVLPLAEGGARAEIVAVANYYEDYIETAGPFDYDTSRIIVEGDKEKLQQLITRPAPGFEGSRGLIGFGCGVEVPDQPRMDADDFEDLEDRLLDDDET